MTNKKERKKVIGIVNQFTQRVNHVFNTKRFNRGLRQRKLHEVDRIVKLHTVYLTQR